MTVLSNKDVLYGKIEYRLQKLPYGSFLLDDTIDVATDDEIVIIGNYKSSSSTRTLVEGTNGVTSAATDNFTSSGATFSTDGIVAGDVLILYDGDDEGTYVVSTVDSETQLSLETFAGVAVSFTGDTAITYKVGLMIFRGVIDETDFAPHQQVTVNSIADEINMVKPSENYGGYTETIVGKMINDAITGGKLNNITCSESSSTLTRRPNGDVSLGDWTEDGGETTDIYDHINDQSDTTYITTTSSNNDIYEMNLEDNNLSNSYHYHIYKIDIKVKAQVIDKAGGTNELSYALYDGSNWLDWHTYDLVDGTWTWENSTEDSLFLTEDDITNFKLKLRHNTSSKAGSFRVSQTELVIYYKYYPNLEKGTVSHSEFVTGTQKTIATYATEFALTEQMVWYLTPDLTFNLRKPDDDSGENFTISDDYKWVTGKRENKNYTQVELWGSYQGGSRITSTAGSGYPIWTDTYPSITDQTELDTLASTILTEKSANQYIIQMIRRDITDGLYQVGETVSLPASPNQIKFDDSDRLIPAGEYILRKIDYFIADGVHLHLDMELLDGMMYSKPKEDETVGTVIDGQNQNTSQDIAMVAGGESVGEANTGSNVGTDGVGVYDAKSGATLQFRHIAPASSKVTVTLNSKDIDIDVDPSVIDHGSLAGLDDGDHDAAYFRETEFLNVSAGAGDAGKPIKLDAGGHIDATMINDADIDHNSLTGLNAGDNYEHITQTQKNALHARQHAINSADDHTGYGDLVTKNENQLSITESQISDLDKYTQAQVDAKTWDASDIVSGTFANARIAESNITQHQAAIDHDALTNFLANEHINHADKVTEQSIGFPADPTDGQLHYDTTLESWYRYNATASGGSWIEIGAGGLGSSVNVSDNVYGAGWDGETAIAPSKNAVYDEMETKSDVGHTHDDRYYTETETDTLLKNTGSVASDDLIHSNDTERSQLSATYVKLKEITCSHTGNIRVYWEHKVGEASSSCSTRVYINGVSTGVLKSTASTSYVAVTDDIAVEFGDSLQIYGRALEDGTNNARTVYAKNMRIKFTNYEFTNNDP